VFSPVLFFPVVVVQAGDADAAALPAANERLTTMKIIRLEIFWELGSVVISWPLLSLTVILATVATRYVTITVFVLAKKRTIVVMVGLDANEGTRRKDGVCEGGRKDAGHRGFGLLVS